MSTDDTNLPDAMRQMMERLDNSDIGEVPAPRIWIEESNSAKEPPKPKFKKNDPAVRSRQAELVSSHILETPITLIGAGGIGSFTALTLAKMGFKNMTVYDYDHVTVENISNQFYRYEDIDEYKTTALYNQIKDFEDIGINVHMMKWTRAINFNEGIVIMAVDSMTVRKEIYKALKSSTNVYGFIDGRMGGQQAEVYTCDMTKPEHLQIYERRLWSDEETSELPCTQKAVMYNVLWIASMICNNVRLLLEEKPVQTTMLMDFENVNHVNVYDPDITDGVEHPNSYNQSNV